MKTKILFQKIILIPGFIISVLMFSASVSAQPEVASAKTQLLTNSQSKKQTQKQPQDKETAYLPNCHCTIGGGFSGCGTNDACKLYCHFYCRHHRLIGISEYDFAAVEFYIEKPGKVSIKIYDMTGRLAMTLADNFFTAGEHSLPWNKKDEKGNILVPGIYSFRMAAGEISESDKLIVMN